ncbi:MAG: MOP flippase family protein [Pseudomonadota bacterium]
MHDVAQKTIKGGMWMTGAMIVVALAHFIRLAVLARYLTPDDFGLMAMVLVVTGFAQAIADGGISNAIVAYNRLSNDQLSSIYWFSLLLNLLIASTLILASPALALLFSRVEVGTLLGIAAVLFPLKALGHQFRLLLQRELHFRPVAIVLGASEAVALALALFLASAGFGVLALLYSMISAAAISSIAFLVVHAIVLRTPIRIRLKRSDLRPLYSFGAFQLGERAVNYLSANLDKLLLGKFAGASALGIYDLAWQLISFPLNRINPIVNSVLLPAYAKLDDKKKRATYYSNSVTGLSLLLIPFFVFVTFYAGEIVSLVFGSGWEKSAVVLKLLSIVGFSKVIANPGGSLLLALDRVEVGFYWNLAWCIATAVVISLALLVSNSEISVALAMAGLAVSLGLYWHKIVADLSGAKYGSLVSKLSVGASVCVALCGLSRWLLEGVLVLESSSLLFVAALCIAVSYGVYLFWFERSFLVAAKELFK